MTHTVDTQVEQVDLDAARSVVCLLLGAHAAQSRTNVDLVASYFANHRLATRTSPTALEKVLEQAEAIVQMAEVGRRKHSSWCHIPASSIKMLKAALSHHRNGSDAASQADGGDR